MSGVIYCRIGKRVNGPFTKEQFKGLLNANKVPVTAEVSSSPEGPWENVASVLMKKSAAPKIESQARPPVTEVAISPPLKNPPFQIVHEYPPPAAMNEDQAAMYFLEMQQRQLQQPPPIPYAPPSQYPPMPYQYPPGAYPPGAYPQQPQIVYIQAPAQPQQPTIHIVNTNTVKR